MVTPNRREFLGALAAPAILGAAAGPKLKTGVIGCGWYGGVDARNALASGGAEIVAVCDVDSDHLTHFAGDMAQRQGTRPKEFKDYRQLLDLDGLEAVIIATPPHWHALVFLAACARGLHIYEEKPLAYDIREGHAMVEAAKRNRGVVQLGFQRRESEAFQQVKQALADNAIGRVVQTDVVIHYSAGTPDPAPVPPPATLDWDAWCGPAPKLPYSAAIGHMSWRLEEAYGNGHLVDWGIHLIDATRMILGLGMPRSVEAVGGLYQLKGKITTPDTLTAHFEFDRCPVVWRHRLWGSTELVPEYSNGITFYGERGTIFATDDHWTLTPRDKNAAPKTVQVKGDNGLKHVQNWLAAVRGAEPVTCPIEDAFRSTATVQLGMISYKTKSRVVWDADRELIAGNPAAAKLLKRPYRAPYHHPYAG
jgi:predicted dehydrogenase